ncbi:hypothetical protein SLS63_006576 [Diaporthe eres]|uniref:Uncharacterized protein n=1 Tax=Diaporthe eres TaxID=83184 RepID=A0ABR1P801_DIAER
MNKRLLIQFYGTGAYDPQSFCYAWGDEGGGPRRRWEDYEDESSGPLPKQLDIKQFFREKGQPENSEFDVSVSGPSHLYHWLRSNDATQLSRLSIFSSAADVDSDGLPDGPFASGHYNTTSEWKRLFELLATDDVAPNLKRLKVYWDCYDGRRGLGKSMDFIQALGKLRPKEHVKIGGYYAVNWPAYLGKEIFRTGPSEYMDPITALGAAGSIVGIAAFGLQLGAYLYKVQSKVRSAKESLRNLLASIRSTASALESLYTYVKLEREGMVHRRGWLQLFSLQALIDLKDTADQCLIIFWRIEATITGNKDSASDEELARKLVQFNKLLNKDETAKVSLDNTIGDQSWSVFGSIRWTYIDFKLDGYSQQLHHYQGCLTLMCSVVSLGELRTIGTQ